MKRIIPLAIVAVSLLLSSCVGQYAFRKAASASFAPDRAELKLTMDDYQYLGETTVSVNYKTYLGIFIHRETVNGKQYDRHNKTAVALRGDKDIRVPEKLRYAVYKALEDYPNADYYIPVRTVKTIRNVFGGSAVHYEMTIKCYKLKQHADSE
jgi:hypothetical protein